MRSRPPINCIGLIPARSGSERVKDKNIRELFRHPLIAYSICSAIQSNIFSRVICVTDSVKYAEIAKYYGAEVPKLRPKNISSNTSTDYEWVEWIMRTLINEGDSYQTFCIIRPTSPFRTDTTITRAWKKFISLKDIDSIRAVEKCSQHPAKMWRVSNDLMDPVMESEGTYPLHSMQYASLEEIFVQNASLEIAYTHVLERDKNISGRKIAPFFTEGFEGFDINHEIDWLLAEKLCDESLARPIDIKIQPYLGD